MELNSDPKQHVNKLYSNLYQKQHRSTIDNHAKNYDRQKALLAGKIKRNKYEQYQKDEH